MASCPSTQRAFSESSARVSAALLAGGALAAAVACAEPDENPQQPPGVVKRSMAAIGRILLPTLSCQGTEEAEGGELGRKLGLNPELAKLPTIIHDIYHAPAVPPPIKRKTRAHLVVALDTTAKSLPLTSVEKYPMWTFNGKVPGPFIRARVGDVVEIQYTNKDEAGIGHNIDFHGVTGPGGGAPALYAEKDQTKVGVFKMMYPGLYVYHCAAAPIPMHIANGMYGLLLVEPEEGLPPVDKEYYVMQSEFYYTDPDPGTPEAEAGLLVPSYKNGLEENAQMVVFNGREGALTEKPLLAEQNDRVRIYFGNAGPNLVSSIHLIGTIMDKVYRDGDLMTPPGRGIQTVAVPAGGSTVFEVEVPVPGNYSLVDHSIFRIDKGAVGFLKVSGKSPRFDIYAAGEPPVFCPGCKMHN